MLVDIFFQYFSLYTHAFQNINEIQRKREREKNGKRFKNKLLKHTALQKKKSRLIGELNRKYNKKEVDKQRDESIKIFKYCCSFFLHLIFLY